MLPTDQIFISDIFKNSALTFHHMDRIYVVIDFDNRIDETQKKVLISEKYTVGMLMNKIRHKWLDSFEQNEALFIFFNSPNHGFVIQPVNKTLYEIKQELGYPAVMNIIVTVENSFGMYVLLKKS